MVVSSKINNAQCARGLTEALAAPDPTSRICRSKKTPTML